MKSVWAGAAALALSVAGFVGVAPAGFAATTWWFPDGQSFTLTDTYDASKTASITLTNFSITEGGATSGRVLLVTTQPRAYRCTTTTFSGTAAQFFPSSSEPCNGWVDFTVNPTTGALSASSGLALGSLLFNGPANGSVTGTRAPAVVVPLQNCSVRSDSTLPSLDVNLDPNPDATTYEATVSGTGANSSLGTVSSSTTAFKLPISANALKLVNPGSDLALVVTIVGKRSDGATVATCTTSVTVPGLKAPNVTKVVTVAAGGLITVNYDLPGSPFVAGIEYRLDNGPWLRPGGRAPLGGAGGSFGLSGIATKQVDLTLRTVGIDPSVVIEGTRTTVTFPSSPVIKPSPSSNLATGSTAAAPVAAPPAMPSSSVPNTSNGAGTGTNGALAANTADAGTDAPCLAQDGTLYPTLYSTVGSQLTMAPNTRGMGTATSFTVVAGALPAGVQLDRQYGVLFGVTTQPGSWTTTVRATFADGSTKDGRFSTRVDNDSQTLQYAAQNIGSVGTEVAIAPTTNAPVTGTTYTLVCGTLPTGTTLDVKTGRILGTPKAVVDRPVPLRIAETSSAGKSAASFIFVVDAAGTHHLSYPSHPHARVGKRITIRPTVSGVGDIAEYRTSIGKLPRGLRLNPRTGVITGRLAHAGPTHTITLVAETKGGALLTAAPMRLSLAR